MPTTTQPIPKWHKSSPLWPIPQNWEVLELRKIWDISSWGTPDTNNPKYRNWTINRCTPTDITALGNSKYIFDTKIKITEDWLKNSSAKILPPNSIVVCTRATIWKAVITKNEMTTNQWFKNIIPNSKIETDFLYYKMIFEEKNLMRLWNWSTFLEVSKSDFEKLKISIPQEKSEQHTIATILSTVDTTIQQTQEIIEKLELRNKRLQQNLLTGKIRLKGFSEKWETVELWDVLDYVQPTLYIVQSTEYDDKYKIPVLTAGKTFILWYTNEEEWIFQNDLPVIIFDDFTTAIKFVDFPFKVKSSAMKILKKKNVFDNIIYIYGAMQQIKYMIWGHERHWISKYAYLTIPLPSPEEQKAIADVFDIANQHITQHKQKLEKLQLLKRWLMQQLLTGKVRVKIK